MTLNTIESNRNRIEKQQAQLLTVHSTRSNQRKRKERKEKKGRATEKYAGQWGVAVQRGMINLGKEKTSPPLSVPKASRRNLILLLVFE